ncbi:hypothetical protein ACMHYB_04415 [Sorangium sp. So ce1128]
MESIVHGPMSRMCALLMSRAASALAAGYSFARVEGYALGLN